MRFLRQAPPPERPPVHEILQVTLAAPARDTECPFGPTGAMDDDGYSMAHSYAEKATIERALLVTLERRIDEASSANLYDVVVATKAYADDLRIRIARFDELEKGLAA
jgi:hypothetical protein